MLAFINLKKVSTKDALAQSTEFNAVPSAYRLPAASSAHTLKPSLLWFNHFRCSIHTLRNH